MCQWGRISLSNDFQVIVSFIDEFKSSNADHGKRSTHDNDQHSDAIQQLVSLHAKLDHFNSIANKLDYTINDSVVKLLNDLHYKVDVIIADPQLKNKLNSFNASKHCSRNIV